MMVDEIVGFLTVCIRSGGEDVKDNDVRVLVHEAGLMEAIKVCSDCIGVALGGDEGNEKGAESV